MPRATNSMAGLIKGVESPYVTVHQERCALVRNRNADCLKCAEACTSGCISFEDGALSISPQRCVGCGTCATVCPTCCLEAHHPNDAELENACLRALEVSGGRVAIACMAVAGSDGDARAGHADDTVRVECLGRVEEALLTRLVAQGASVIELVHGRCAECARATGKTVCDAVLATEAALLEAWGSPNPILCTERDGVVEAPVSNEVSGDIAPQTPAPTKPHFQKVMADGTLPHFVPDRRERLLDALAELGAPGQVTLRTRLWGHVEIDLDRCVSCRMCAVFCPTGAIRKFDAQDGFGIVHAPGDCVRCMTCQNICRQHAIRVVDDVDAADLLCGRPSTVVMRPQQVVRGQAHTIEQLAQLYTATSVYSR